MSRRSLAAGIGEAKLHAVPRDGIGHFTTTQPPLCLVLRLSCGKQGSPKFLPFSTDERPAVRVPHVSNSPSGMRGIHLGPQRGGGLVLLEVQSYSTARGT